MTRKTNKQSTKTTGSTKASVAQGQHRAGKAPRITPKSDGNIIVSQTEYLLDVSDGGGSINSLTISAGLQAAFPWLSRISSNYEQWRIKSLVYHYTPTCSTSTSGVFVMAVDYDASDIPPADKVTLSSFSGSARGNVWVSTDMRVTPNAQPIWYYTAVDQYTVAPTGADIKLYCPGVLYYGVFNGAGQNAPVGEITVSYEIEFMLPQTRVYQAPSARVDGGTSTSANNMLGNSPPIYSSGLGLTNVNSTGGLVLTTPGEYELTFTFGATNTASWAGGNARLVLQAGVNVTTVSPTDSVGSYPAGSNGVAWAMFVFKITAPTYLTLTLVAGTWSALVAYHARIAPYKNSLG